MHLHMPIRVVIHINGLSNLSVQSWLNNNQYTHAQVIQYFTYHHICETSNTYVIVSLYYDLLCNYIIEAGPPGSNVSESGGARTTNMCMHIYIYIYIYHYYVYIYIYIYIYMYIVSDNTTELPPTWSVAM